MAHRVAPCSIAARDYHKRVNSPDFPKRDPAEPEFWNLRYQAAFAPWQSDHVPERLRAFVEAAKRPLRILVPGCGSALDVRFLAERGWEVLGIDFSAEALSAAASALGPCANRLREADFFAPLAEAPFDVVYERALLCALPRRRWSAWGLRMGELVRRGGSLAGFFYFDATERGPPFALHSQHELEALLGTNFERLEDSPVGDSIPVFAGKERWQVWRRL